MPANENEKRVAVMMDPVMNMPGQHSLPAPKGTPDFPRAVAQLIIVDQSLPLAAIIKDFLCPGWKLETPEDFALQFQEPNKQFITERNRTEIQNGSILTLTYSPSRTAQTIYNQLLTKGEEKIKALKQLSEFSMDVTFAQEFIAKEGLNLLASMVQSGSQSGETQAYTLRSFVELMYHGIVSWDVLEPKFIKTVSNCVSTTRSTQSDATTLQSALEILESIVINSTSKYELVEQEITPENLSQHLNSSNQDIQIKSIALLNALFMKGEAQKRNRISDHLRSKRSQQETLRNYDRVIRTLRQNVIRPDLKNPEMCHQLYVLQTLMFNLRQDRMRTPVDINNPGVLKDITELRKIALDSDPPEQPGSARKQNHTQEFKKLGFKNTANPAEDFVQTPPGVLALENMLFFAKHHGENYTKVVLENSSRADNHDLPFARASIELTSVLCEILKVGEQPSEEGQNYYPMFFFHEKPFEEFYCYAIQLMNKTWKEMRATTDDFTKVLSVVKEQLVRALDSRPMSFDQFRAKLNQLTYSEINKIWEQQRRHKEEWESQAKPIVELREQLKPEITELIKQQRLNFLIEGTMFTNKVGRSRDRKRYCRLSPNHKVFYYGDADESNCIPSIEQLNNKLAVVDIKGMLTGKQCPHMKDVARRQQKQALHNQAFSIQTEMEMGEPLNFIAPSEKHFQLWTDGINALLGNSMTSELAKEELEILLRMEVKLRLLDLEGEDIKIPDSPPPIPKEPADFDFAYKNI